MAGFSATKFVPIAYAKFNLDIEGDFLRFRNVHVNNTLSIS